MPSGGQLFTLMLRPQRTSCPRGNLVRTVQQTSPLGGLLVEELSHFAPQDAVTYPDGKE